MQERKAVHGRKHPNHPPRVTAIILEGRELGHVHSDRGTLDLPLAHDRRKQGWTPAGEELFSGWVSKPVANHPDVQTPSRCWGKPTTSYAPVEHHVMSRTGPGGWSYGCEGRVSVQST